VFDKLSAVPLKGQEQSAELRSAGGTMQQDKKLQGRLGSRLGLRLRVNPCLKSGGGLSLGQLESGGSRCRERSASKEPV
jgi:hypothetical protein